MTVVVSNYETKVPVINRRDKAIGCVIRCQKHDRYCGPAAVSALIGASTGQVAKVIHEMRLERSTPPEVGHLAIRAKLAAHYCTDKTPLGQVRGVFGHELNKAIRMFEGFTAETFWVTNIAKEMGFHAAKAYSLANFMDHYSSKYPHRKFVVTIAGHFVAVQGEYVCDNFSGSPLHRKLFKRHMRAKVISLIEVIAV